MPVRFLISTLKSGVDPQEYEDWVRERDYALVRSKPNYLSYKVHRIRRPIDGAPDETWQYVKRVEIRRLSSMNAIWRRRKVALRSYGRFWTGQEYLLRQRRDRIKHFPTAWGHLVWENASLINR
jgi:hypothetical protein